MLLYFCGRTVLIIMFRYFLILSLACLLLTDEVSAWRGVTTIRRHFRFIPPTAAKAHTLVKTIGKRSTNDETYTLGICKFDSFDLDADQQISEEELSILIDITGLLDLDELFEKLDVNKDDVVTRKEYDNSPLIKESCY